MADNNINNLEISDDELDNVSGGTGLFSSIGECNCCHKKIYFEDDAVRDKNGKLVCIFCQEKLKSPGV